MNDIFLKVKLDYGDKSGVVIRIMNQLQAKNRRLFNDRVVRAILFVSKGDLTTFHLKSKQAQVNWRDILVQAEYNEDATEQVRDFNKTFEQLGLLG